MTVEVAAKPSSPVQIWSALSAVYVLWGSTYLGIAVVVHGMPPLMSAGARFLAAGLIVAAGVAIKRRSVSWLAVSGRQLVGACAIGLLLLGCGNGGVVLAERYVPSSMSALIVASVPLWIVLFRRISGDIPTRLTLAGVACGLAGVVGLVVSTQATDPDPGTGYVDLPGWQVALWLCVVICGSMCWALGSLLSPKLVAAERAPADALTSVVFQFLAAGVVMSLVGLGRGEDPRGIFTADTTTYLAFILIVIGGVVAYSCYVWLLQHAPVSLVSTYAYVNPVIAVFLGWLLLSEPVSWALLAVGVLVVIGVLLVVRGEQSSRLSEPVDHSLPARR